MSEEVPEAQEKMPPEDKVRQEPVITAKVVSRAKITSMTGMVSGLVGAKSRRGSEEAKSENTSDASNTAETPNLQADILATFKAKPERKRVYNKTWSLNRDPELKTARRDVENILGNVYQPVRQARTRMENALINKKVASSGQLVTQLLIRPARFGSWIGEQYGGGPAYLPDTDALMAALDRLKTAYEGALERHRHAFLHKEQRPKG